MIGRLSLRARLILGVIALAAAGLAVASAVTYTSLRSFLIDRTDSSLDAAHISAEGALHAPGGPGGRGGPPDGKPDIDQLTARVRGIYVQVRKSDGATIVVKGSANQFSGTEQTSPPKLPAAITLPKGTGEGDRVRYFTVDSTTNGGRWRVRASVDPGSAGYVLIVATSLNSVDGTLHRLLAIEGLVALVVLAGIAALGLWVIRIGLRPLTEIGATADTIAAGDLSHRVARAESRTEVGRLGLALNAMLGQIETAFHARDATERKLRRFVADASHELRTPLAAVRAYAELFSRGAASRPDDLERSLAGITRESERMTLLVEDLLLLARLDEGRPLAQEPVALADVVGEAVETARMLEPERRITLAAEPLTVVGDRDRLRQIVDNLLANVRAHAGASASVAVSLHRAGDIARLTVADDGPGLNDESASRVFERFYRADPSRARTRGGAGLGLSIVAAVAEAHHGAVAMTSAEGEGARFVIDLPIAHSESTATP